MGIVASSHASGEGVRPIASRKDRGRGGAVAGRGIEVPESGGVAERAGEVAVWTFQTVGVATSHYYTRTGIGSVAGGEDRGGRSTFADVGCGV